ncbi:hypothetical protein [Pseudomonas sp. Teo4]|uniref:hypothetical protein n=1 Tax=Pseudomonas sp. Teo4 TaxID=3064528 RepID=UPI002ACB182F|nr:hypothetical protein [Pseudomonas sp. Teo4]
MLELKSVCLAGLAAAGKVRLSKRLLLVRNCLKVTGKEPLQAHFGAPGRSGSAFAQGEDRTSEPVP